MNRDKLEPAPNDLRTSPSSGQAAISSQLCHPIFLPAAQGQRSKDVTCLTGASKAVLHGRSQEATVGGWLKSARQSGPSDGLRVSVI